MNYYGQNGETGEAEFPGAGHLGLGANVQNHADFMLQEPDFRLGARMSGPMAQMSGPTIPDLVWGGHF